MVHHAQARDCDILASGIMCSDLAFVKPLRWKQIWWLDREYGLFAGQSSGSIEQR